MFYYIKIFGATLCTKNDWSKDICIRINEAQKSLNT